MARSASPSTTSTLSCINVEMDAVESLSTPPTSVTDAGSVTPKNSSKNDDRSSSTRNRRVNTSMINYNETILSGRSIIKRGKSTKTYKSSGNIDSETSFDIDAQQLVHDSIETLDLGWSVESLSQDPQQAVHESTKPVMSGARANSTILGTATSMVNRTTSVLGKRSRAIISAGVSKIQVLGKRASVRIKQQAIEHEEEPVEKKIRLAPEASLVKAATAAPLIRKPVKVPTSKRWLARGLYVGQDPDFDPRMTDTKNKLKKASSAKSDTQQRSILPLPMFAGKRLLETGRAFQLPFDAFNPLPNGQPKPEEWRKVGKNVFIGDSAEIWRHTKLTEVSKCLCTPDMGCDDDCINQTMFYECDNSNCNVGVEHCKNRSFELLRQRVKAGGKYNIGVEVVKTKDKGYGVRSNRTFQPHQIIVEYTGEIITPEECDRRMYDEYLDNECFYLMVFDQNMIIDATRGSIARFVNHSCEPNCKMVKWTVAGKPRMALFAGEMGIMTGEELTYDYNFDPFSSKNIQACRCGKSSCRGVLGPKQKETKDIKEALRPITTKPSAKRKIQEVIENVAGGNDSKKRKVAVTKSVKKAISAVKATATKQLHKPAEQQTLASMRIADRTSRQANRAKTKRTNVRFRTRTTNSSSLGNAAVPRKRTTISTSDTIKRGLVRTMTGKTGGRSRTIRMIPK